jgi:hypothetical protein
MPPIGAPGYDDGTAGPVGGYIIGPLGAGAVNIPPKGSAGATAGGWVTGTRGGGG